MPRAKPQQEIAWQPHPGPQTRLLTCPCDDILYGGARGGGKTDGTIGVCIAHATQHPEHARILYLRRTMPELEDVVVRSQPTCENGDIVAALLDDEATVKTFKRRDGHVWLMPHNPAYEPILGDDARILGKVVSVLRRVR